jgi:hypothetical protein
METQKSIFDKIIIDEIASCPILSKSFILTILTSLEMSHEILYDLTRGIGGKIDPDHLPIIKAYLALIEDN